MDPKELTPHEDVFVEVLRKRLHEILTSTRIYPIIVEKDHRVILDGHHRWYATLELGIRVPAYVVSYSEIGLDSWSLNVVPDFIVQSGDAICIGMEACSDDKFSFYWSLHAELTRNGVDPLAIKGVSGKLKLPTLDKDEVIKAAKEGLVYPPKTTRHIINFNVEPVMNVLSPWTHLQYRS